MYIIGTFSNISQSHIPFSEFSQEGDVRTTPILCHTVSCDNRRRGPSVLDLYLLDNFCVIPNPFL